MTKRMAIGIVGCGAIGTSLAKIIVKQFQPRARLAAVYDIDAKKSMAIAHTFFTHTRCVARDLKTLIGRCDLVIEAASAKCSFDVARAVLSAGKDIIVMSVGGVVGHYGVLAKLAALRSARLYIPSGAIAGIDALKAARLGIIKSVTLTTRKPPQSFKSVPYIQEHSIDLNSIRGDTVIFSGTAIEAIKYFPQNINVAGILSLAGFGPKATKVCIVASPAATRNSHEIVIESTAGTIISRTENVIHPDNPKTSYLAVLSAAALISQILDPAQIGT